MNPRAFTVILCPASDGEWFAPGDSRREAELFYMAAILTEARRPPMYRFVIQLKVDQHEQFAHQLSLARH